ncbi:hypothetical protein PITC_018320 [Penicillium italicum]|uniref:Uncharacterized protein n=1 Tax=Penicillium italicum TaxID=40296 RepID=A0A0A2L8G4_PENIT|nr:hypothetical protein PITC_018320 [Penicillium italicum]
MTTWTIQDAEARINAGQQDQWRSRWTSKGYVCKVIQTPKKCPGSLEKD